MGPSLGPSLDPVSAMQRRQSRPSEKCRVVLHEYSPQVIDIDCQSEAGRGIITGDAESESTGPPLEPGGTGDGSPGSPRQ